MDRRYPAPDRSDFRARAVPSTDPDVTCFEIGWATGMFSDGRPWRAEGWSEPIGDTRSLAVTFFFSMLGLEHADETELVDLLESEGVIKFRSISCTVKARTIRDAAAQPMWAVTIVLAIIEGGRNEPDDDGVEATPLIQFTKYPPERRMFKAGPRLP